MVRRMAGLARTDGEEEMRFIT
eukprot:COSAG01_NODE_38816_length_484_cov_17.974026_2_plen_21_part_01